MKRRALALCMATFTTMIAVAGCGDGFLGSIFGGDDDDDNGGAGDKVDPNEEGGILPGGDDDTEVPCTTNLCAKRPDCGGGATTSISGRVYDPAGKVPLYNVIVYVPNSPGAKLDDFKEGVSCDRCGEVSGDPMTSTLTNAKGEFKLDKLPVDVEIPIVIQVGKWRRQFTVPAIPKSEACKDKKMDDPTVFRMPRNKAEGHIPQMAVVTGTSDPIECLLQNMGIDDGEFTRPDGAGRVHIYRSLRGVADKEGEGTKFPADTNPSSPGGPELWDSLDNYKKNDMVLLPCEGAPFIKTDAQQETLKQYADIGGRVFTTHFSYVWLAGDNATNSEAHDPSGPWATVGQKGTGASSIGHFDGKYFTSATEDNFVGDVDTTFPKGKDFASWLQADKVNASPTPNKVPIREHFHDLIAVNNPPAQRWIYADTDDKDGTASGVYHTTFNTPLNAADDKICGRVVFSDFHVSTDVRVEGTGGNTVPIPGSCKKRDLTAQEKILEFMLFDLASCVQNDNKPPTAPRTK